LQNQLPKEYLSYPKPQPNLSKVKKLVYIASGIFLAPIYWSMSYFVKTPGLRFRKYFILLGVRLLIRKRDLRNAYRCFVTPLDSFRYFEFDFMWQSVRSKAIQSYMDVSSPRLFPLMLIDRSPHVKADLLNPDARDLAETALMAETLGLKGRCRFHSELIDDAPLSPGSFDLITSMSVIEHITDDKGAIKKMWDLLKPGGRLLITLPCAATAYDEYMNCNDYELNHMGDDGFLFFQRYYDEKLIQERIFSITGKPQRVEIYAEKQAGSYKKNEAEKRVNPFYPSWRGPFDMGVEYEYKTQLSELPGIGVIAFDFVKNN
jgi:SAM-dependent methyltransferase